MIDQSHHPWNSQKQCTLRYTHTLKAHTHTENENSVGNENVSKHEMINRKVSEKKIQII